MQQLSVNPYSSTRWSDIRVIFGIVDIDAAEDTTATATSEARISQLVQTHNRNLEMKKKLATMEHNCFVLNGSFELPSEDNEEVGWWSGEISDTNGVFKNSQVLEFVFSENHSSVGFMVIFDDKADEWATDFTIRIYDDSNVLVGEDIVVGNKGHTYTSETPIEGYGKVKIAFTKTSKPHRRVRVCEVVFGIIQSFDKHNTTGLNLLYEMSPKMESLPANELMITIDNRDRKYNMINPQGIYKFLQQGQGLDVKLGVGEKRGSLEYINMGRFYYTSSTAEDDSLTAQIIAHDRMYSLGKNTYRKGMKDTATVETIVDDILSDSGANLTVSIPAHIASRVIGRNIPIVSHREAFRMVAQAAMSTCYINRNDVLVFEELPEGTPVDILDNNNMYAPVKVGVSEYINVAEVVSYDFSIKENSEIYKADISIKGTRTLWIEYSGASVGVIATITGGTINNTEFYLYAAKLIITAEASVTLTLTGNSLEQTQTIFRTAGSGQTEIVKRVENPLIKGEFVQGFASWILENEQKRLTYTAQERGNPAREIGDTIKIYDAYKENRNAIVTKEEYQFDGTLKVNTTARGGL